MYVQNVYRGSDDRYHAVFRHIVETATSKTYSSTAQYWHFNLSLFQLIAAAYFVLIDTSLLHFHYNPGKLAPERLNQFGF